MGDAAAPPFVFFPDGGKAERTPLIGGAARSDITPQEPMFLYGYPHVPRTSTAVHDPLYASALYLRDERQAVLMVSADLLILSHEAVSACRADISAATGVPAGAILISATHTHSAPVTAEVLAFRDDPLVPSIDSEYMHQVRQGISGAAIRAVADARPVRVAVTRAHAAGVGGNRHSKGGPSDPQVGVVAVRDAGSMQLIALDLVYSMHPTVLHEDSTAVSADFPGYTRSYLADHYPECTVVYHTGPSGDQSPRYYVTGQTFDEAQRLGYALGEAVRGAVERLEQTDYRPNPTVAAAQDFIALPGRTFPQVEAAEAMLATARANYARLWREGAPHGPLRTAEVAVFGAEERVTLARAQARGEIEILLGRYTPVEVQVLRIGGTFLVGLPGELFVEYGLAIKAGARDRAFVISLANGELQGYVVTPDATGYEAGISLFLPEAGTILVESALRLMEGMGE